MSLDRPQLKIIEQLLDRQYVALLEEIRAELVNSGDPQYIDRVGHGGADSGEEAMRDLLTDLNGALFDRHIREIREIEDARTRIREGLIGICADCGEDIRFERLQALPVATRCITCQEKHDRVFAHQATPTM